LTSHTTGSIFGNLFIWLPAREHEAERVGVPAEQASAVFFALTNAFLTGSVLPIDGGALLM
jgi:NAD(P)-dependent dehydrogenase (short-subunit alcohol dehydrogenase family)